MFLIISCVSSQIAFCSNWQEITQNTEGDSFSVDASSVVSARSKIVYEKGDIVDEFWMLIQYKKPRKLENEANYFNPRYIYSGKIRLKVNCAKQKYSEEFLIGFDKSGNVIWQKNQENNYYSNPSPIVPDTVYSDIYNYVCRNFKPEEEHGKIYNYFHNLISN
jgi:hypothetical protein